MNRTHDASFVKSQTQLRNENVCFMWIILRRKTDVGVRNRKHRGGQIEDVRQDDSEGEKRAECVQYDKGLGLKSIHRDFNLFEDDRKWEKVGGRSEKRRGSVGVRKRDNEKRKRQLVPASDFKTTRLQFSREKISSLKSRQMNVPRKLKCFSLSSWFWHVRHARLFFSCQAHGRTKFDSVPRRRRVTQMELVKTTRGLSCYF